MSKDKRVKFIAQFSIMLAILAIFCFTPLGSIPVGPIVATLAMLPVIITAFSLGTGAGALMGFFAGLFSLIVHSFIMPGPTNFIFTPISSSEYASPLSLIICFVPRILVGVVAGALHSGISRKTKNVWLSYGIPGVLASLTNTILVLGLAGLFFTEAMEGILGMALMAYIGMTVLTNGIPEAVVSLLVSAAMGRVLKRMKF